MTFKETDSLRKKIMFQVFINFQYQIITLPWPFMDEIKKKRISRNFLTHFLLD